MVLANLPGSRCARKVSHVNRRCFGLNVRSAGFPGDQIDATRQVLWGNTDKLEYVFNVTQDL